MESEESEKDQTAAAWADFIFHGKTPLGKGRVVRIRQGYVELGGKQKGQ